MSTDPKNISHLVNALRGQHEQQSLTPRSGAFSENDQSQSCHTSDVKETADHAK